MAAEIPRKELLPGNELLMTKSRRILICLAGGSPLRGCVSAGGLMVRKQITKKVKGAEKTKRVSEMQLSCKQENRMWT